MSETKNAKKKVTRKSPPKMEEGDKLIIELMGWMDRLHIKRLAEEKADLMKRCGEYLQKKKAGK